MSLLRRFSAIVERVRRSDDDGQGLAFLQQDAGSAYRVTDQRLATGAVHAVEVALGDGERVAQPRHRAFHLQEQRLAHELWVGEREGSHRGSIVMCVIAPDRHTKPLS